MTVLERAPTSEEPEHSDRATGLLGAALSTDHKVIGLMTLGTAMVLFLVYGAMALTIRAQLARPNQHLVSSHVYNQLFTLHGSGMIFTVITPFALGLGVYLVPLQVGAPSIAAPRTTLLGYWLYVAGALSLLFSFANGGGGGRAGWFAYTPLSDATFTPGPGMDLWILGGFLSGLGMLIMGWTVMWTALRQRAPGMTMLRLPLFTWSEIVTCFLVIAAFPALLGAMALQAYGRADPSLFNHGAAWNVVYENLFWFYGHPVVYVMFFPFVGCVIEVLATCGERRYAGYKSTVTALMVFSVLSMAVWGHHMFITGQVNNDYYSTTSLLLAIPAGVEYFSFLSTILTGRLSFPTPMLFALAFIPQFLIGGITGIMSATPILDYHFNDSFFAVGHFHYTLFAGSVFGFFAGVYFWFPKATGWMLSDRLGKLHFWLMVIGTNATFIPFLILGYLGMPRRVATYPATDSFPLFNAIASAGAAVIGIAMAVFVVNVVRSMRRRTPAPADPWGGHSLEWITSSPPPRWNYLVIPPIHSPSPVLDLREAAAAEADG